MPCSEIAFSERNQPACVIDQSVIRLRPVEPAQRIVLAVRVVVAALGMTEFVAREQHRCTLGQKQRRQQSSLQMSTQPQHFWSISRTFYTAVPTAVMVVSVAIVFTIFLVMLMVVTDQIAQREAIVRGNEVDAGGRQTCAVMKHIARTRKPPRKFAR